MHIHSIYNNYTYLILEQVRFDNSYVAADGTAGQVFFENVCENVSKSIIHIDFVVPIGSEIVCARLLHGTREISSHF